MAEDDESVQFHENGKRHKENVAKKISDLSKKSAKAFKESKKVDEDMKKMEEAALKAYMKDIESNPDFTSQQYVKIQEEKAAAQQEEIRDIVKKVVKKAKEPTESDKPKSNTPNKKLWYESKSEEGHTYYWNIETNASAWEAPEEGFVSIEEQEKKAEAEARLKETEEKVAKANAARLQETKEKEASKEALAYAARESMKKFRKEEVKETPEPSGPILGPTPKIDPYGNWTAIQKVVPPRIDWQLPQTYRIAVPQVVVREPQVKIKEKKMASLADHDSNSAPVFKKRKQNPGRMNMRQRQDDD